MLHARERERERSWLMGCWKKGALADITWQAQSILVLIKDLNESQHVVDGTKPLLVLPVIILAHGVKLFIIEVVHDELTCPWTKFSEVTKRVDIASITVICRGSISGRTRRFMLDWIYNYEWFIYIYCKGWTMFWRRE